MSRPHRSLALVTASLPQMCAVCGNKRRVNLLRFAEVIDLGDVDCPHCNNGTLPIPILTLPMRHDTPKGGAA